MVTVNIHAAKTQLSRLLKRVEGGEEIILARAGKPVAKLVPADSSATGRAPGLWRRKYPHLLADLHKLADGIDEPLAEDELAAWEK